MNESYYESIILITTIFSSLLAFPVSALVLFLLGNIFKEKLGFGKSLIAALIITGVSLVFGFFVYLTDAIFQYELGLVTVLSVAIGIISFVVNLTLHLTIPKFLFGLKWERGLMIGGIWYVILMMINAIIGILVGTIIGFLGIYESGIYDLF